jgi:hypothetical protein
LLPVVDSAAERRDDAHRMHMISTRGARGALVAAVFAALGAAIGAACTTDPNSPEARREAVRDVLSAQLAHEQAMLQILETERANPEAAVVHLQTYVTANARALDAIAAQRALLEREPAAVALAMHELQGTFGEVLNLRRRLAKLAPELMGHTAVREALATLDAL